MQAAPAPPVLRTARLILQPVTAASAADLARIRTDPVVMATMRGGVETPDRVAATLADYIATWARGFGMYTVHDPSGFVGEAGIMIREDHGPALRFAFLPVAQGRGYAREAMAAILDQAYAASDLDRLVGVTRDSNRASQRTMEALGMTLERTMPREGSIALLYVTNRAGWLRRAPRS